MSYFLLLVLGLSVIFIFNLFKRKNPKKTAPLPPGPKGLPFIGILHEFDAAHPHVYLRELAKGYGPLMSIKLGSRPAVVISSARVAKIALKNNDVVFSGRPPLVALRKYSYDGNDIAFSDYDQSWREMRKLSVIHLFSAKQVSSFLPIRREEVSRMIKGIMNKSESSEVINLSQAAFFLSNRIICRAGFGKELDEAGKRKFDEVFKETQVISVAFFFRDFFPSLSWIDNLTGTSSRLEKNLRDLDDFFQELIDDHLDPNRPESMRGDILDLLIKLKHEQAAAVPIEWENIKGILMNVFIAGTDTSAALIVWAMTALIKKPEVLKKAQEEVRNVVGSKGTVDEDDIQNLPYLKAIIKEALRLFPPAPLSLPRETIEKCTIDGTIDYKGHDFGFIPFGSGRRGCPGTNFGVATVELGLANLLYSFEWGLPHGMKEEDVDMEAAAGLASHRKNDLFLVAKSYI
ncbi:hypothetical protein F511_40750 [Dorcoceras hygrometricum]|uniref:Cytochrome P450 n=1 Tax=Dorcoceras hygrometricum TaxID=472368 RepID=A0A2Z7BA54_9LAMI|nr:hypothetical protein F511_40750 [Dorcoceras hygrometricum]